MTTQSLRHIIAVAMVWLLAVGQTLACTSFIVSGIAIKFLISYVRRHDFSLFGYYRIALGVIVIAYFLIAG